jgi:hypothetical protein
MLSSLLAWVEDFGPGTVRLSLLRELPPAAREALRRAGVLQAAPRAASLPCAEHADCAREVRAAPAGARLPFVALCTREPPECPALDVADDEVAEVRMDLAKLARTLADLAEVQGELHVRRARPGDLVRLGRLAADAACEVFFVARPEAGALAAFLASRERARAPVRVLVPTSRRLPADLASRGEIVVLDGALTVSGERLVLRGVPPGPRLRAVRAPEGAPGPTTMPAVARWSDVCFEPVDNHTVMVRVGERAARRGYHDFGMTNEKTREPKKQWHLFQEFLDGRGVFNGRGFGSAKVTKRLVSTLRADLKRVFALDENPIDDYVTKVGWVARFRVGD